MEILINGEVLSHTLEGTETLADILRAIEETVRESGGAVASVLVDGQSVSLDFSALEGVKPADISVIAVEAHPRENSLLQHIGFVREYISTLDSIMKTRADGTTCAADCNIHKDDIKAAADMLGSLDAQAAGAPEFSGGAPQHIGHHMPHHASMRYLFLRACALMGLTDPDPKNPIRRDEQASRTLRAVAVYLDLCALAAGQQASQQAEQKTGSAQDEQKATQAMADFIPCMRDISHLLMGGDEELALQYFIASVDILSLWLRIIGSDENAQSRAALESLSNAINEHINTVMDALQARDFVGVSDILEYEIIPAVESHIRGLSGA